MDGGRSFGLAQAVSTEGLHLQPRVFLFRPVVGAGFSAGATALDLRFGHAHHLVGDLIGLLLIFVSRRVDDQFRLDRGCGGRGYGSPVKISPQHSQPCLIAKRSLQLEDRMFAMGRSRCY